MNKLSKYKICGNIKTTSTGKLIYLVLDEIADRNEAVVIPQRKICDTLQISRSAVSRNLRRLERAGAISIITMYHSDGGRAANKYLLR